MISMEFLFPRSATEVKFSDLAPRPGSGAVREDCHTFIWNRDILAEVKKCSISHRRANVIVCNVLFTKKLISKKPYSSHVPKLRSSELLPLLNRSKE